MNTKYKIISYNIHKKSHRKFKKIILHLFSFLTVVVLFFWSGNNLLKVSSFTVNSNEIPSEFNGMKILQLTDLHSKSFGKDNKRLIAKIDKMNPDIIVVTGDMLNAYSDNGSVFLELCQELTQKYPVYYTYGNHEEIIEFNSNRIQLK